MIAPKTDPTEVFMSEQFEETDFGIAADGMPMILDILRNKLYSDKILAVIREYTCNAFDANVDGGNANQPVELTLPTTFEPTFRCRDFGPGLSARQISEIFTKYGSSTKRNSNDFVGMLGIGAKAGFSYGDNFVVVSYRDGMKTTYNCYIDPTKIGKIARMAEEPSDAPSGLEIVIPVKAADVGEFHQKCAQFVRYCRVRPVCHNLNRLVEEPKSARYQGDGWSYTPAGVNMVVMGNIGYPLDAYLVPGLDVGERNLAQSGLILEVKIGDVDIAASREALEYTEKTRELLEKRVKLAMGQIVKEVEKEFAGAPTMWEAKCRFRKLQNTAALPQCVRTKINAGIKWCGKLVTAAHYDVVDLKGGKLVKAYRDNYKKGGLNNAETNRIEALEGNSLFINDTGVGFWSQKRMETWFKDGSQNTAYIFTFPDDASKDAFLKEHDFEGATWKLLSSVPKAPPTVTLSAASGKVVNPKHSQKIFKFDPSKPDASVASDSWEKAEIDLEEDEGVYVEIDRFEPKRKNGELRSRAELARFLNHLKEAGLTMPVVYGVKADALKKFAGRDNWSTLWAYTEDQVELLFQDASKAQRVLDYAKWCKHPVHWKYIASSLAPLIETPRSLLRRYLEALQKMQVLDNADHARIESLRQVLGYCELGALLKGEAEPGKPSRKPSYDLDSFYEMIWERYPMFRMVAGPQITNLQSTLFSTAPEELKVYAEYVNQTDRLLMLPDPSILKDVEECDGSTPDGSSGAALTTTAAEETGVEPALIAA